MMHHEVTFYGEWMNGEVYGFSIFADDSEIEESCGGFIGHEGYKYMMEEAKATADRLAGIVWEKENMHYKRLKQ